MNASESKKIHYSYYKLNNLKNSLYNEKDNLQTILNAVKSVDERLYTSFVGRTSVQLRQKTNEIEDEINKMIETLTEIISNVNISNETALGVDMDLANQMGVN